MDVKARVSSGDELLNEKFTIPSIITTPDPIDFNTFTTPGIYYVGASHNGGMNNFINNGPIDDWGTLFVSGTGGILFQLFFADIHAKIFHRYCKNSSGHEWSDWVTMVDEKSSLDEEASVDKAFPVGFSYLSINNVPTLPSFGGWSASRCGYIYKTESSNDKTSIYKVTREF